MIVNAKNKKKSKVDTRLKIFNIIGNTIKCYIKNFIYIFCLNLVIFTICELFIKKNYIVLLNKVFSIQSIGFYIVFYGFPLFIMYAFKTTFFSSVLYNQKSNTDSSIMEALDMSFKRFLPIFGNIFLFALTALFFGLFFVIPGILFLFYCYFSAYLCGIGDINNTENGNVVLLNGTKAFARSYNLVKGNFLRFVFLTIVVVAFIYFANKSLISYIISLKIGLNEITQNIISFSIFDIAIIYSILVFFKLEKIESDTKDEKDELEAEERALMMQQALKKK
jgi:hypothetical protein